ncbi:guanine nucleotide-binding protein subunit alpha [Pseudohyphozyma bogoriensis]|nr:guanine nucleotide-binding protein subunit alpha [Pseudohyphozyma bogoriensis]
MGCANSSEAFSDPAAEAQSRAIDQQLEAERKAARKTLKILVLGTGESGKSTILKQLQILHSGGFDEHERRAYVEIIYSNTIQSMQTILDALPLLPVKLNPLNESYALLVQDLRADEVDYRPVVKDALLRLTNDPALWEAMDYSSQFQLNNSAGYFFKHLNRTLNPSFLPTDDDIIHSRVRTTGIINHTLAMPNGITWKVFDVGGQRSERRKWLSLFEDVNVLLFLVAISEFDEQLFEDETVSRLVEAKTLFESIANSRWFVRTTIILFLNKIDLFQAKLERVKLRDHCPSYTGANDYESAANFMLEEFSQLYQPKPTSASSQLYAHFTQATDTRNVKRVTDSVADTLTRNMLKDLSAM